MTGKNPAWVNAYITTPGIYASSGQRSFAAGMMVRTKKKMIPRQGAEGLHYRPLIFSASNSLKYFSVFTFSSMVDGSSQTITAFGCSCRR